MYRGGDYTLYKQKHAKNKLRQKLARAVGATVRGQASRRPLGKGLVVVADGEDHAGERTDAPDDWEGREGCGLSAALRRLAILFVHSVLARQFFGGHGLAKAEDGVMARLDSLEVYNEPRA